MTDVDLDRTGAPDADWTQGVPRLVLRFCGNCGHLWYLPRQRCARCASTDIGVTPSRGNGTCVATTVVHLAETGDPVGLVLVALDEGPIVMGRMLPGTTHAPEPGSQVVLEFTTFAADAGPLPTFGTGPFS